ncbi:MAG: peptide chain release factor N(5)-glutamine methyltransferase [bacterium]|nr:peptide chain release factor N(5)-glutamine methyltransferase [bacterium]
MTEPSSDRLIDVINWGRDLFARRGVPHARYTIEVLLEHILAATRAELYCERDRRLAPEELRRVRALVQKRLRHRPLWHLVGSVEFFGVRLSVDDRVLIPRPETEIVVETALRRLPPPDGRVRYAADVGTGSGNIAIALAASRGDLFIYATDVSPAALEVAAANARACGRDGAMSFARGDLFGPFEGCGPALFDLIVSNPPYVSEEEMAALPPEVREREPRLALDGGADGLSVVRRLLAGAPRLLKPGGLIVLEVGSGQAPVVRRMAASSGTYAGVEIDRDYAGVERVVSAEIPGGHG